MATISSSRLRQIIKEELLKVLAEGEPGAATSAGEGEPSLGNAKETTASKKVGGLLSKNKALQSALDSVTGKEGAADVVGDVVDAITRKGVDKTQLASKLIAIAADLKKQK